MMNIHRKKRIVFSILNFGFGGAERVLVNLANEAVKNNYEVKVLTYYDSPILYSLDSEVTVKSCACTRKNRLIAFIQAINRTRKFIKAEKPDCLISFLTLTSIIHLVSTRLMHVPLIIAERNDPGHIPKQAIYRFLRLLLYRLSDGFVFQTNGAKSFFSTNIQNKSIVIHNPVDLKYSDYPIPYKREKIIVNIGRLFRQKNQKLLINAFSNISNEFPDYLLHIYGEGDLKNELIILINDLGLNDRVFLMGTTNDLLNEIANASLFVLSSDYEGMPNALIEALALGIPSISSDCPPGGPSEIINHEVNGLLFPVGDINNLIDCMRQILSEPDIAEKLGKIAKNICITHSVENIFSEWNSYIIEICTKRQI